MIANTNLNTTGEQCPECKAGYGTFHSRSCSVQRGEDQPEQYGTLPDVIVAPANETENELRAKCEKFIDDALRGAEHSQFLTLEAPGFRTVFLTQIHSCYAQQDEADAWMAREEMLPFAPVPKTIFTRPDGWVAWAVEVQWDGEMFVVYSKRHTELFDRQAQNRVGRGITEIVREYEQQGWTFIGNGINPPIENLKTKEEESDEPRDE